GLDVRRSRLDVVRARDGDRLEALEGLLGTGGTEVRGQVRVVQPMTVPPGERAVGAGRRTEGDGRITVGDEAVLVVPRQRPDRASGSRLTTGVGTGCAETVAGAPAGVCRLRPRGAAVEREVDARHTDAVCERAGVVGARV